MTLRVKTQIWIAVPVYVLVAIVKKRLGLKQNFHTILQALSGALFDKMPILSLFPDDDYNLEILDNDKQLKLLDIQPDTSDTGSRIVDCFTQIRW